MMGGTQARRQQGFSLMEVLVSMSISLVVTASMIALMANSLANTARVVHMSKLTDDLRTTMQLMSRDVRRSSYTADAIKCFANIDCAEDSSVSLPGDVTISAGGTCLLFLLDRDHDGDATENDAGGFRWVSPGTSVGRIEMWVGDASPDCTANHANWVALTDFNEMDITGFTVDNALSYDEIVLDDGFGNQTSQRVRKIRMNIQGRLVMDNSIARQVTDVITIRNHLLL